MTRPYQSKELPVHRAVLHYLQTALPGALIHHSAQNLSLGRGSDSKIARAVALAKSMGMRVGFPDLLVIYRGRCMGFEIKAEGGRSSAEQMVIGAEFWANGAAYAVVRSIDDVQEKLAVWGVE